MSLHFDSGDCDDGHWYGEEVCCLECGAMANLALAMTPVLYVTNLICGECGEAFGSYEI